MKKLNHIVTIFFCLFIASAKGQFFLKDHFASKYSKGELKVRWEPRSLEEWYDCVANGYKIRVYENNIKVADELITVTPFGEWDTKTKKVSNFKHDFYEGAKNMIYQDKLTKEEEKINYALKGQNNNAIDSFRLGMLIYTATYDFDINKMAALGYAFAAKENVKYKITISVNDKYERTFECVARKSNNTMPSLVGEWGDKQVTMKWKTADHTDQYFGYFIEKSKDNLHFTMKDSIPYINTLDKYGSKTKKETSDLETRDSLDRNYVTYYYRIRGMDYFGEKSEKQSSIAGYGFDKLTLSPMLIFADQTEDNQGHLKWKVVDKEMHLIKDFTLFRSDSITGKYEIVADSINKSFREIKVPLAYTINYFRIEANPKDGKSMSSAPIFIMGQDTTPPAKPIIITATLDSLNRAVVKWHSNIEPDLWGYRVFKSNFERDEFTLLNAYPKKDTFYIDTIDLQLGTKNIFYLIEASDKRNNRSPFSDTIRIELPDHIPPAIPVINNIIQVEIAAQISFQKCPSKDFDHFRLYRKNLKKDVDWTLVHMWDSTYNQLTVLDSTVIIDNEYAYAMTAVDRAKLESKPSIPFKISIVQPKEEFKPFIKITQTIDEKTKKVSISWQCKEKDDIVSVLIYRGESKEKITKHAYVDGPANTFSEPYDSKYNVYRIQPYYKSRLDNYVSDYIVLVDTMGDNK